MINRGIIVIIGLVAATAGLVLVALMVNPAQAGDPLPGLDISVEQIPGGQAVLDIVNELGRARAYTQALHITTQQQLEIAEKLTEHAHELAMKGDLERAASLAIIAAELEQRIGLKFKAAAGITELYTRAITQNSTVSGDFGARSAIDYNSSRSNTTAIPEPGETKTN